MVFYTKEGGRLSSDKVTLMEVKAWLSSNFHMKRNYTEWGHVFTLIIKIEEK
jgi:hypothetical protein